MFPSSEELMEELVEEDDAEKIDVELNNGSSADAKGCGLQDPRLEMCRISGFKA